MKKAFIMAITVVVFLPAIRFGSANNETRLMRYPDVHKDKIAFVYGGDLWLAPRQGGQARRLTSHPGEELFPKFSPDGQWIAFTGEYDGNADVFIIPAEGGEPRRLTYHPSNDGVLGWTPDSKKILFRSTRYSPTTRIAQLFLVPVEGGFPEMLPIHRAGLTSFSPDGKKVAYNPVSTEFRTWKRYRGGWLMNIGIFDLEKKTYEELPRLNANDMFPMWHRDAVYFASDRDGITNLFRYDLRTRQTRKLTDYREYDVKWPSLGPDAIIYENGGYLYTLDPENNKTTKVSVSVAGDLIPVRPEIKGVTSLIRSYALSPTGVRAVFGARGDIFTLPVKDGSPRNLTDTPGVHELNPTWSPDGRWIAYFSDKTGEYELYLAPQKGGEEVRVTSDGGVYRFGPAWSPDSKKLLYWDKTMRLYYVDVEEKKPVQIDQGEFGFGGVTGGDWSPDSQWVVYTKTGQNLNSSIYLYSLADRKVTRLTDGFYTDHDPVFDQNGKYLYFLSHRHFYPSGTSFDQRFGYYHVDGIFAVLLQADQPSPFAPRSDEEEVKEEKKPGEEKPEAAKPAGQDKPAEPAKDEKEAKPKEPKPIKIDLDGIQRRVVAVPVASGTYSRLLARKEKIFYMSIPFESQQAGVPGPPRPRNTLHVYDVKEREGKPLLEGINDYDLDKEGKKVIYRAGTTYGVTDAIPGKAKVGDGTLNVGSLQARVDPREEWKQMFREAWRIERDFYWDPNMKGLNWEQLGKRYEALLPYVAHRSDLNYIIGEMIAELSTSHTYVGGGDTPEVKRVGVGLLGADFEINQGFYRIKKIYRGENWNPQMRSPLDEPGLKVKEGHYIIAVNGRAVTTNDDIYAHFQNLADRVVTLKVNDKPSADGAWEILVRTVGSESGLRYLDWVESNRRKVEEATGGRVGYMHVPDTSISGLIMFDKYLTGQIGKEGFIIDERYNGGGMIPDFFTEKLGRGLLSLISPREGKDVPWPPVAIYGPKVMLINEHAGSGGDAFPWFFKREKIGPLVGTRTWGGLIGISRSIPMIDGGSVTAPEVAFWSTDNGGEWIVENKGVDPDYRVEDRPDLVVQGHDPQLEKGIELVMEQWQKNPVRIPKRPPYPVEKR
jgi:tricorn protease